MKRKQQRPPPKAQQPVSNLEMLVRREAALKRQSGANKNDPFLRGGAPSTNRAVPIVKKSAPRQSAPQSNLEALARKHQADMKRPGMTAKKGSGSITRPKKK